MPWKIRKSIVIVSKELVLVLRERFLWNEVIYLVLLSTEFPGKKWIAVQVITAKFKHKRKLKKVLTNLKLARNFSSNSHHQCSKWTPLLNLLHLNTFFQEKQSCFNNVFISIMFTFFEVKTEWKIMKWSEILEIYWNCSSIIDR